jgi:N-formylglutamate amidohydrolase
VNTDDLYEYRRGHLPLLVNIPHAGLRVPDEIFSRFNDAGKKLPDTDWHVPKLYDFATDLGAHMLIANYSRYVVDLNRPPDGASLYHSERSTGLIPGTLFDGSPLYADEKPDSGQEITHRIDTYWRPYHRKITEVLRQIKEAHGYALLYDAHSIASRVPNLFDGKLPDLNLGTANGESCAPEYGHTIADVIRSSEFTSVVNGRFIGGYITRHYGSPTQQLHAVQMEIAQVSYMNEANFKYDEDKATRLIPVLAEVLDAYLGACD